MRQDELRHLLHEAVPDLPAPEDRLGAVRARVRRTRWRLALVNTVAVLTVGLAIGVPRLVTVAGLHETPTPDRPPLADNGCPAVPNPALPTRDRPGPLVGTGAVRAILCSRTNGRALPTSGGGEGHISSTTLTTGVGELVAALNALPDRPADRGLCTLVGYPTDLSLALRYPNGSTTVVWLDRNCNTASAGGRIRYGSPVDEFQRLYRAQVAAATNPETIPEPVCPDRLAVQEITRAALLFMARDEIARYRGSGDDLLPSTLAEVTACRYRHTATTFPRQRDSHAAGSESLRALLNAAAPTKTTGSQPRTETCMDRPDPGADVIDLVIGVDAAGMAAELIVLRTPCAAVFRNGYGDITPTPDLLAQLDTWLGPVPN